MDPALLKNSFVQKQISDFISAAGKGNKWAVLEFLKKYPDAVDEKGKYDEKHTALSWASCQGQAEIVKLLLENDAAIDKKDDGKGGWTPLMHAVYQGKKDVVEVLLENGAALNTDGDFGGKMRNLADPDIGFGSESDREKIAILLEEYAKIRKQQWLEKTDCSRGLERAIPITRPLISSKLKM